MMMMSGFLLSSADADEIVCIFLNYLSKNNERDKDKCDHHLAELATIVHLHFFANNARVY
jgi:hypothetical protein